ncbi:MAG: hypothetical protein V4541_00110 [Bacteroidota bacterium]
MKHIVTLSLVFLSMTQLSRAEKVEGLRLLTERYCNKQQTGNDVIILDFSQLDNQRNPFLLTNNELTLIGTLPELQHTKYRLRDQMVADLTIREKPKNNSP